ncbi:MAG: phosphoribosyltransferase family protein [bacterium]|nr:phosphoribosyltransferase family protein [bacterium]
MPERTRLSSGVITLSLFRYSTPPIRQVVRHIKYRHAYTLAEQFGDICKKYAHDLAPLFPPDASVMVIPIPISSKTKRTRGYNHTEIFARAIADAHRWDMRLDALKKIKHTPSQTTFHTKQERKNNIKNSIALSDAFSPKGKTILLVDDVLTTGATLNECARLLQNAGAKKIFGIVVAKG